MCEFNFSHLLPHCATIESLKVDISMQLIKLRVLKRVDICLICMSSVSKYVSDVHKERVNRVGWLAS